MTLASLAAVILSFSLVQVDDTQRRTAELVEREAAQIDYCDRLMGRYGQIEAAGLRPLLLDYADSVINDEWPALQADRSSERTAERLTALIAGAAALDPAPGRQATVYADCSAPSMGWRITVRSGSGWRTPACRTPSGT